MQTTHWVKDVPLVSVVVLTYNQEHTVGRTIESILNQQVSFNFELILGEDCSTDQTRAVCERFATQHPDKIRLLPAQPNKGLMKNYRDCLTACTGDYVAVCAGDDWWHNPDKLQMQADHLDNNPNCGLVYTNYDIFQTLTARTIRQALPAASLDTRDFVDKLLQGFFLPTLTIMYRRALLQYIDFEQYIKQGYRAEDLPMFLTFALHGTLDCINISTATYTAQAGSLSNFDDAQKMEGFMLNMRQIRHDFVAAHPEATMITIEELDQVTFCTIFLVAFTIGNRQTARQYAKRLSSTTLVEKIKVLTCSNAPFFWLYLQLRKLLGR